jgi:predicted RNA binding protein YcfA (HicA-like mRNA interferase family)
MFISVKKELMSKLFSSKEISYALGRKGFHQISQKGSHAKFTNASGHIVIVPMAKRKIPEGTLRSILRQAEMSKEEFKKIIEN